LAGLLAAATIVGFAPAPAAVADPGAPPLTYTSTERVAPGVVFKTFQTTAANGPVLGDVLEVDLRDPHVSVDLLHPPVIAARDVVSHMADAERAVAGVNGDFFNINETHVGVTPTGSSVGPEISHGHDLKAAVPNGQRFGPALPVGTSTEDVIGIGADRIARVASLHLVGTLRAEGRTLAVRGLNQYALPVGGIGAFTDDWGAISRERAVCGTDAVRTDPCSTDTAEVTVRRGVVTQVTDTVGEGAIPSDTTVLVGRERGADALRALTPGDRVRVRYHLDLDADTRAPLRFAIGGFPILLDGEPLTGLDATAAPRTAAGISPRGRTLYLVVVDGRSAISAGMNLSELSALLERIGADDGVNLDGGGSSTVALRAPGAAAVTVRNVPSDGIERPVANGVGVFAR
jgi:hypothetical protein